MDKPADLGKIMVGAPMRTRQRAISWPKVLRSLERFKNGETPSDPIRVDPANTRVIEDGKHRYIAATIAGEIDELSFAQAGRSGSNPLLDWADVKVDSLDWGD